MSDHTYRVIEVVGTSAQSVESAIESGVAKASKTLHNIRWFQVIDTRGHLEDAKVQYYQVTLKLGFTLDE